MCSTRGCNRPTPGQLLSRSSGPGHWSQCVAHANLVPQHYFLSPYFSSSLYLTQKEEKLLKWSGLGLKSWVLSFAEILAHELAYWAIVLINSNLLPKPGNRRITGSWCKKGLLRLSNRAPTFHRWGTLKSLSTWACVLSYTQLPS